VLVTVACADHSSLMSIAALMAPNRVWPGELGSGPAVALGTMIERLSYTRSEMGQGQQNERLSGRLLSKDSGRVRSPA